MLSKQTQQLLKKYSTEFKVVDPDGPVFHLDHRSEKDGKIKPDIEAGLKQAKGYYGGIKIHTPLNLAVADINRWIDSLDEAGTLDEADVNLVELCNEFLAWVASEGIDVDGLDANRSSVAYKVWDEYSNDMSNIQAHINAGRKFAIDRLCAQEEFYRQVNFDDKTPREVMRLAHKFRAVSETHLNLMAKYLTQKEEAESYYETEARANRFPVGDKEAAVTFALLYLMLMTKCADDNQALRKNIERLFLQKFRAWLRADKLPERNPREDELEAFWSGITDPAYRGFGALLNLHFEGFHELIVWKRDGTFVANHAAGCTAVVMLEGDLAGISADDVPDVLVLDGFSCEVKGRTLNVTEQFRHADIKPANFGASDYAELAAIDPEKAERMKATKFRKNVWVGGIQSGNVEYVRVYKNSIKVWLSDFGK